MSRNKIPRVEEEGEEKRGKRKSIMNDEAVNLARATSALRPETNILRPGFGLPPPNPAVSGSFQPHLIG